MSITTITLTFSLAQTKEIFPLQAHITSLKSVRSSSIPIGRDNKTEVVMVFGEHDANSNALDMEKLMEFRLRDVTTFATSCGYKLTTKQTVETY